MESYGSGFMRLEGVAFRYRRKDPWVFRDVTLSFPPGGVTEVTGRNGAGKSTLLRVIAGLRTPGKGVVSDRPKRVGYAPERFPVNQPFTVRSYLDHMAAIRRVPAESVGTWVERLGLDHLLGVRLPELSKGSAQKVGLAQALLDDPGLLILDEPFAGLDAATRDLLPALISEIATGGTTVVVSDHQRCIEALPEIDQLRVADGKVTSFSSVKTDWTVLEVEVPADQADTVETKLRADGYRVRRPGQ
ncbi:ATP-binding cassette domain-containing protein [Actinomadura syzygii]|nr:ABC transporter ATP-binding protein [Actinomadura syzygii]